MFNKLLKYHLQSIYKQAIIFMAIVLICAITSRLTAFDNPPFIVLFINKFTNGCAFGFTVGLIINVVMRTWARFITNTYGDESYLTHTLPVSKRTIWASIFAAGVIVTITSILTFIIAILIMYGSPDTINAISQSFYDSFGSNIKLSAFIIVLVFGIFLQLLFTLQAGFCGIIIGYRGYNYRLIRSVVYSIAIYILGSIILFTLALIWSCFDHDINQLLFQNVTPEIGTVFRLLLGIAIVYFIYITSIYFINAKLLSRGVDVE